MEVVERAGWGGGLGWVWCWVVEGAASGGLREAESMELVSDFAVMSESESDV